MSGNKTIWHITFGTYGARLHGGDRQTVGRWKNRRGDPYIEADPLRYRSAALRQKQPTVLLTETQRRYIETTMPEICARGGWVLFACAAAPNHIHVLCSADGAIHGKQVRTLLKRWLGQRLDEFWRVNSSWWAVGGSTKAVKSEAYLGRAIAYVMRQRTVR